jgi:hypothetical protein
MALARSGSLIYAQGYERKQIAVLFDHEVSNLSLALSSAAI